MQYSPKNAVLISILILTFLSFTLWVRSHPSFNFSYSCVSVFLSTLIPVVILSARHHIRLNRLYVAEVFRSTFEPKLKSAVLVEFIRRKYLADVSLSENGTSSAQSLPRYPFSIVSDWTLLLAATPFVIFTATGIFILLFPSGQIAKFISGIESLSGGNLTQLRDYESAITIASLAFASALLYSIRLFIRSLVAFDLSAITFLRAFAHMLFATALAVMLWRIAPDLKPMSEIAGKGQGIATAAEKSSSARLPHRASETSAVQSGDTGGQDRASGDETAAASPLPKGWLVLAFILGFIPDAALSWTLQRGRMTLSRRYSMVARHGAVTPLTVIEGIDFLTAFRLDEGNIGNVQALAAANPILVHVETSHCIFLIADWIAQAQLCTAVGPQRFLLLRRLNIRTIFDIERAVLDTSTPVGLKQIVGAVLLANGVAKTSLFRDFGVRPLDVAHRDFDKALASGVNVEVIEHLVKLMIDNLHVHRFRQVCQDLEASLTVVKAEAQRPSIFKMPAISAALPSQTNGGHDLHPS